MQPSDLLNATYKILYCFATEETVDPTFVTYQPVLQDIYIYILQSICKCVTIKNTISIRLLESVSLCKACNMWQRK